MKKLLGLFATLVVMIALYSSAWFFMAYRINHSVDGFYNGNTDIEFYGPQPSISGFPYAPTITYTKGFSTKEVKIIFSEIIIKGFPIPTWPLEITNNSGLNIQDNKTNKTINLDSLKAELIMPKTLPSSSKKVDIAEWQNKQGVVNIQNIETAKAGMNIQATGTVGLDSNLQPTLNFDSIIKGHEALVQFFVETGQLKPLPAALALSALNAMVTTNPQTHDKQVELSIKIQDRVLFLGPIRTIKLPPVYWH